MAIPTLVLIAIGPDRALPSDIFSGAAGVSFVILGLTYALVGAVIGSHVPGNRIGWVFCLTGFLILTQLLTWQYADVGLHTSAQFPSTTTAEVINSVIGEETAGLLGLSLLLFPDGHLPSRRWRPVLACVLGAIALLVIAGTLRPGHFDRPFAALSNPLGIPGTRAAMKAVDVGGWLLVLVGMLSGAASMVVRLRRAHGIERQQLKLVLAVGGLAATAVGLLMATWLIWPTGALPTRMAAFGVCFTTFPVAAGIAILRYRLYDIDIVFNRTLVYAAVTVLLALAFGVTTLLLGTALGHGSAWATAGATLVVTLAFRPLRDRVQDAIDRRFNRARYEALHRMGDFLEALRAGRTAPEEVEGVLRGVLVDPGLELRFFLPESELYVDSRGSPAIDLPGDRRERIPIERAGQPLAMVLYDAEGHEHAGLLRKVIEAGGLAIEIARLRVELRRQLAEVKASRSRIIEAGNEERRRIERDLHDGAQQRLVSIGLALRHAQHQLTKGGSIEAGRTLEEALGEVAIAIEELRELAHGLPPAQLDAGLMPAFRELARRVPLRVDVSAPSERFNRSLEAAAYFIACEGLTNAVKHASAERITLSAEREDGKLMVTVEDDGVGGAASTRSSGLTGLGDRIAALGGTLRIESTPGAGTTLTAELPCAS